MVAAIYQGFIKDEAGNIIDGASVEVRDQDTNALVDLWSNRATTTTKTNPTTTDANGYYFFYRTAGRYKITVTSATYSAVFNNVNIGTAQEYDTGTASGQIPLNSDLATVAGTGDYDDLINKPTLGTVAALDTGTASGEIRTNSQNDLQYFKIANNLSEGTASAMRVNLALGSGDDVTFNTVAAATIDTGQGAVECYAMDQAVRTTDAVTFAQINADNIRIDDNTISSTDTNGNITIDPNGTGTVELAATTNVTGAITATTTITANGTLIRNGVAGATRGIQYQTNGSLRWQMFATSSAESGSNAGSDFSIARYDDAGSFLSSWLTVNRATGATTITGNTSVTGAITATADATINGLTIGKGAGNVSNNTAVGVDALDANTSGHGNIAVGFQSMQSNTTGVTNTAVGRESLKNSTTADNNTAVGYLASALTTTGDANTAIGRTAFYANTVGYDNVAIGLNSGRYLGDGSTANTNSIGSVYIGHSTKSAADSTLNETVIGYNAIGNGSNTVTIGNSNVTANYFNGAINATADATINGLTIGKGAGNVSTNTAVGVDALDVNTSGSGNTAQGYRALLVNTSGIGNTAIGGYTLDANTTANNNTAVGYTALSANTTGTNNTAVGVSSLLSLSAGSNNTALGLFAGRYIADGTTALTTASNCTYLGVGSKASADVIANETVIGYNTIGNGSNTVTIGNSSVTANYFNGAINATGGITTNANAIVNGASGANRSLRFNTNNVARWQLINNSSAESGSNAGSNFQIYRFADDGSFLSTWLNVLRSNGTATINGDTNVTGAISATTWAKVGSYTVGTVPSAATAGAGAIIYVSNETGGATIAFSDATNWRRVSDRAIIA